MDLNFNCLILVHIQLTALKNKPNIFNNKQMNQSQLQKQKPSQKTHVKLPYLQRGDKPKPKPKSSTRNLLLPEPKLFNLSTSNSKLPQYNPQNDANLKFFFQKPTNKKLLQKLKDHKLSKKSQYIHQSISQHKNSAINLTPINQSRLMKHSIDKDVLNKKTQTLMMKKQSAVTSHEFLNYLENVRKRILSTGANTQLQTTSQPAL